MNVKNIAKESAKCKKLDLIENEAILLLFGKGCQSLCTTIAQVYEVNHNRWTKKCSGVLCFIKDNTRRSYYMRMYCLILHEMVWEQEIYYELVIERLRSFFLQFEGNVSDSKTFISNSCERNKFDMNGKFSSIFREKSLA